MINEAQARNHGNYTTSFHLSVQLSYTPTFKELVAEKQIARCRGRLLAPDDRFPYIVPFPQPFSISISGPDPPAVVENKADAEQ